MAYQVAIVTVKGKKKLQITTDFNDPPKNCGSDKTDRVATSAGNSPCGIKTKDGRDIVVGFNCYSFIE
jgi:hypothetical protein